MRLISPQGRGVKIEYLLIIKKIIISSNTYFPNEYSKHQQSHEHEYITDAVYCSLNSKRPLITKKYRISRAEYITYLIYSNIFFARKWPKQTIMHKIDLRGGITVVNWLPRALTCTIHSSSMKHYTKINNWNYRSKMPNTTETIKKHQTF